MKEVISASTNKPIKALKLGDNLVFTNCRVIECTKDLSLNINELAPANKTVSITVISGSGIYDWLGYNYYLQKGIELYISNNFGDFKFTAGTIIVILY